MADKIQIERDNGDADEYEPTDSEDNYSEEDKELLRKVRKGRPQKNSKQELLAFDESEEEDTEAEDDENDNEDEDDDAMRESDIEGASDNEKDMPDGMSWGSKVRNYYSTDFVDPDFSTYTAKELEMALMEEEEAKAIQSRLLSHMKEKDFELDDFESEDLKNEVESGKKTTAEDVITVKADFSGLSQSERERLFEKDSPEFQGLVSNFKEYLKENQNLLVPVIEYIRKQNLPMIPAFEFTKLYQDILLTYCCNVSFYLLLKAKCTPIRNHPIIKRLLHLNNVIQQLQDKYENIIKPQLEALLERIVDGDVFEVLVDKPKVDKKKCKLSILEQFTNEGVKGTASFNQLEASDEGTSSGEDDEEMAEDDEDALDDADEMERRGITYQMAKNKGLTPHRKKELRNPRVKHRSKFRKALIRRKGAVRTVRNEVKRYGGEISGIKATVSKSIKFKT